MIKANSGHDALRLAKALVDAMHGDGEVVIKARDLVHLIERERDDASSTEFLRAVDARRDPAEWATFTEQADAWIKIRDEERAEQEALEASVRLSASRAGAKVDGLS